MDVVEKIEDALSRQGLLLRGAFHISREKIEALSPDFGAGSGATVFMIGNAGPQMWQHFSKGRREEDNPLDCWVERLLKPLADALGARLVMPSDGPPYAPFQQWAMRSEPVHPSPIGPLIHPHYGLWHAYRAALVMAGEVPVPPREETASPCENCAERPCLTACPVSAFRYEDGERSYDYVACQSYLHTPGGEICMAGSCQARRACPVGREWTSEPPQARFHMRSFRKPLPK